MKKLLLFFFVTISVMVFACKCDKFGKIGIQFQKSDFVGEIEILKISPKKDSRSYIAEIKTLHLYKGKEINKVEVLGKTGDIRSASCEIQLKIGEKYIAYLSKRGGDNIWSMTSSGKVDITEEFFITSCTPMTLISAENKNIELEKEVLDFYGKNDYNLAQAFYFNDSEDSSIKNFELTNQESNFAVFRIKVNNVSKVDHIEAIRNFGSDEDQEVMEMIKKNYIIIKDFMTEVRNEDVLLTLFYLPENKKSEFRDTITLVLSNQY